MEISKRVAGIITYSPFNKSVFIIKHIGFYLAIFSAFSAIAQSDDGLDPKAKKILDEVSAKTKTYSTIKADFTYTLENNAENISDMQEGSLVLKGNMYRLEISGQEVISDGKTRWTYLKDAEEVQVSEEEIEEGGINPTNIFSIYEEGFKYKYYQESKEAGKDVHLINLYPIDASEKSYHTVRLSIDKSKKQLVAIKIFSKDGNDYIYKISSFITNQSFEDSFFRFVPADHPGVEVIDMR